MGEENVYKASCKYEFDNKSKILFKHYFGRITLQDIISSWEIAFENKIIPKNTKRFILDYRKASFNLRVIDYKGISDFYKKHLNVFKNAKIAIVTDSYKDIVVPVLVQEDDFHYFSQPFSTIEAAINWVLR
jgi:hypothetical protein